MLEAEVQGIKDRTYEPELYVILFLHRIVVTPHVLGVGRLK